MNISERIQFLRKTKGISQEELADKLGISRQAVSKWESEQSTPDLDKVLIMSEYFDVTTDYILKGIESLQHIEEKNKNITSQILYISSTAFLAIGLLCAFSNWYAEQSSESIWGSMIIQVVGVVGYFIGKLISKSNAPFIINWFNIIIILFIPISMVVAIVFNRIIAPYPTDFITRIAFAVVYLIAMIVSFAILNKKTK